MRRTSAYVAFLAMVVALLYPSPASAGAQGRAIDSLNKVRRAHGLRALRPSGSLAASANRYAHRMMARNYFGHLSRIPVAGRFRSAGETLARHPGLGAQPRRTVRQWMHSPPHRAVLLSSRFHMVGMGMARGRFGGGLATIWVAHVGSF